MPYPIAGDIIPVVRIPIALLISKALVSVRILFSIILHRNKGVPFFFAVVWNIFFDRHRNNGVLASFAVVLDMFFARHRNNGVLASFAVVWDMFFDRHRNIFR